MIDMDANLHHPSWNPVNYKHKHFIYKELIRSCGSAWFKVSSQKGVPTFYPRARGKPTTIDLTWINSELAKKRVRCWTSDNNYGSDHQTLITTIELNEERPIQEHNSVILKKLDKATYYLALENWLSCLPGDLQQREDIDEAVENITDAITDSFLKQGKLVKTNQHQNKVWWDEERLRPLIKERNRACRWMMLSGTYEAARCYWEWSNHVKYFIHELKRKHWRVFLAKTQSGLTFKACKYTQTQGSHAVAPLYRADRTLATYKEEQAKLQFAGTSVVNNE